MKKIGMCLLIVFIVGFVGVQGNTAELKDVRIGAIGDLSGPVSQLSGLAYGLRDHFLDLNDKGGINGHQIDYTLVDGAEIIPIAVSSYKRLISRVKPHVLFRWGTGGSKAVRKFANEIDKVVGISNSHSGDLVDPVKLPYDFTFGPTYVDQIKMAMKLAKKEGAKTVALMGPTLEYSKSPRDSIIKGKFIEKIGLELVADIDYNYKPTDLTPEMIRLKKLNPDLIYVQDVPAGFIPAIRSAAKVGLDASKLFSLHYSMHDVIPSTLKKDSNGVRAFKLIPELKEIKGTPIANEIEAFLKKHRRRNIDKWYLMGWMRGKCMSEAIRYPMTSSPPER